MTVSARIPVYLLTGFLGSGKTTLLNQWIQQPAMSRTLVIINEFGAVSLDHLLVSHANEDIVVEIGSGCLCCTIRGDLAKTLRDAVWRFAREGQRQFDRVIIETTGLADPAPVIHTLLTDDKLFQQYRLQGVVTTVDAVNGAATLQRHPESQKQVGVADVILLTKTDLLTTATELESLTALQQRLTTMNPSASLRVQAQDEFRSEELLALDHMEPVASATPVQQWLNVNAFRPQAPMVASGTLALRDFATEQPSAEQLNRHDDHIQAHCFIFEHPFQEGRFEGWLQIVMQLMGHNLLRVKGLVHLAGYPGPMLIHGVQHVFHPTAMLAEWPDDERTTRLVFITYDIDRDTLARTFELFLPNSASSHSIA